MFALVCEKSRFISSNGSELYKIVLSVLGNPTSKKDHKSFGWAFRVQVARDYKTLFTQFVDADLYNQVEVGCKYHFSFVADDFMPGVTYIRLCDEQKAIQEENLLLSQGCPADLLV